MIAILFRKRTTTFSKLGYILAVFSKVAIDSDLWSYNSAVNQINIISVWLSLISKNT